MNKPTDRSIEVACTAARNFWNTHGIKKPVQFVAFCLSLLPIPVISEAGKALDRHLSDKASAEKSAAIWEAIKKHEPALEKVATLEESVKLIAQTLEANTPQLREVETFTRGLCEAVPDFQIITENHSYQELVHCIVEADVAQIVARNFSKNRIERTTIEAERTHLHASNNSQNLMHETKFTTKGKGSVGMNVISQQGNIFVGGGAVGFAEGGSLGFGPGGMISFGAPSQMLSGPCPLCGATVQVEAAQVSRLTHTQCPACKGTSPVQRV